MVKHKKGGFVDMFLFMIFAFIIVLFSGIFIYMADLTLVNLHESMDHLSKPNLNYSEVIDDNFGAVSTSFQALYWISIVIIIGMVISIFIGSYLVTTKPIFFVPYIFMMIIAVTVSVNISNAYEQIATNPTLGPTFVQFTGANFFLANLPLWITIIGFIGAIIMFSRMGSKEEAVYFG